MNNKCMLTVILTVGMVGLVFGSEQEAVANREVEGAIETVDVTMRVTTFAAGLCGSESKAYDRLKALICEHSKQVFDRFPKPVSSCDINIIELGILFNSSNDIDLMARWTLEAPCPISSDPGARCQNITHILLELKETSAE